MPGFCPAYHAASCSCLQPRSWSTWTVEAQGGGGGHSIDLHKLPNPGLRPPRILQLEHLDGHKVQVGAAGVTRPGETRWFQGEGMPRYEKVGADAGFVCKRVC